MKSVYYRFSEAVAMGAMVFFFGASASYAQNPMVIEPNSNRTAPAPLPMPTPSPTASPSVSRNARAASTYESSALEDLATLPQNYVGGHRYLPSLLFPQPFATSSLTFGLATGILKPDYIFAGSERTLNLVAIGPTFQVQVAPISKLALSAQISGGAITGINTESAVLYGASTGYQGRVGALYNFLQDDRQSIALEVSVSKSKLLAISPLQTVRSGINRILRRSAFTLSTEDGAIRLRPGLHYVYTASETLGVLATISGTRTVSYSTTDEGGGGSLLNLGFSLDMNLKPKLYVPIGLTLGYQRYQRISGDEGNANIGNIGLYETISTRFNFGFEFGRLFTDARDASIITIVTRYYY